MANNREVAKEVKDQVIQWSSEYQTSPLFKWSSIWIAIQIPHQKYPFWDLDRASEYPTIQVLDIKTVQNVECLGFGCLVFG